MGSELLQDPDRLESILKALVQHVPLPITCKIRLIPDSPDKNYIQNTIDFVSRIQKTGISAIGVHCRFTYEKPREPGHWTIFQALLPILNIPLIANGDFYTLEKIKELQKTTPVTSFMLARGAMWDPAVFTPKETKPSIQKIMKEYFKLAEYYEMPYKNAKYVLLQMDIAPCLPGKLGVEFHKGLVQSRSLEDIR
jgi:tRNA-dihydrouridine synthase 2